MCKDTKDFFISYNKADKEYAKWIAGTLEENDYTTYIQAWDFRPGNNFILQMQNAIKKCKKTIIVLSQNYLNSEYCQAEWAAAYNYDPTGKDRKLIPVRVDNVRPDGLLSSIIYIDLYKCDEENATKKLLNGIDENENPRRKPNFPLSVVSESRKTVNIENDESALYFLRLDSTVSSDLAHIIQIEISEELRRECIYGVRGYLDDEGYSYYTSHGSSSKEVVEIINNIAKKYNVDIYINTDAYMREF